VNANEYVEDAELEEIKRRKLIELQRRLAEEERRRRAMEEAEARKQALLRRILTPEARQRLANIKLVRPDFASFIEDQLITLVQSGRLPIPVTDELLRKILEEVDSQTRRETKIRIREKGW